MKGAARARADVLLSAGSRVAREIWAHSLRKPGTERGGEAFALVGNRAVIGGGIVVSDKVSVNEQIASHLKHAQELRKIAIVLSLRQARAAVVQAAVEHEQLAASLANPH